MKKLTILICLAAYALLPLQLHAQVTNDDKINYYVEISRLWTTDLEGGDDEPAWRFLWRPNESYNLPCNYASYQNGWCKLFTVEGTHTVNQEIGSGTNKPASDFISYSYLNWENDDTFSDDCELDSDDDNGNCGSKNVTMKTGNPCEVITELTNGFNDWCWVETKKNWRYTYGETGFDPLNFGVVNNETKTHFNSTKGGTLGNATSYGNLWSASSLGFQPATDVTYAFQLTEAKRVTISTDFAETNFDTYIHLLSTTVDWNSFGYIVGNDNLEIGNNKSKIERDLGPGYYYIIVEGFNSANGLFKLSLTSDAPAPANDGACGAISVPTTGVVQTGFTNQGATVANGEQPLAPTVPNCVVGWCAQDLAIQNSVWFKFVAPASGRVEISTCDLADFDTQIALYSASDCGDFATYTLIAANDDGPSSCATDFDSWMDVSNLNPGQTYYILVDGYNGEAGAFDIYVKAIITSSTGSPDIHVPKLTASPNPNNGNFKVDVKNLTEPALLNIVDITGRQVYSQPLTVGTSTVEIQLTNLTSGMYFLNVVSAKQMVTSKMYVQRDR